MSQEKVDFLLSCYYLPERLRIFATLLCVYIKPVHVKHAAQEWNLSPVITESWRLAKRLVVTSMRSKTKGGMV